MYKNQLDNAVQNTACQDLTPSNYFNKDGVSLIQGLCFETQLFRMKVSVGHGGKERP